MNINFNFFENISKKNVEPIIGTTSIKYYSDKNRISNYFYNLTTEEIEMLDKIYDYSQQVTTVKKYIETINKDYWLKYKTANSITIYLSETPIKSEVKVNNDNSVIVNYGSNQKFNTLIFNNKELYAPSPKYRGGLFEIKKEVNDNEILENAIYMYKKGICKNSIEYLFNILDCLFSSNNNYYIKKCNRCNKYYLTTRPNKLYCYRSKIVCNTPTTCHDSLATLERSKEYIYLRRKVNNHLSKYRKKNDIKSNDYINKILNTFNIIMDNCKDKLDITNEDVEKVNKLLSES